MTTHRKLGAAIALVTDRSSDRRSRGLSRHHPGRRSRSDRNRDRHGSGAWNVFDHAQFREVKSMSPPREGLARS